MSVVDLRKKIKTEKPVEKTKKDGSSEYTAKFKEDEIAWQIPEYEYQPKDISWYWLSLIAAIILTAFAIWQRNFLFAVFIIIAFLLINYAANRFPAIWEIKINEKGLTIAKPNGENKKFYPLESISGFDIHSNVFGDEETICKELVLEFNSKLTPYLKINIYSEHENKISDFLLKFVPKKEYEPSLVDSLAKLVGF